MKILELRKSIGSLKRTLNVKICKRCFAELGSKFRRGQWSLGTLICPVREKRVNNGMGSCYGHYSARLRVCRFDMIQKMCKEESMINKIGRNTVIPHWCPYEVEHILSKN